MAASALEVGDRRLAYAAAMSLAEGARIELPLAREDHHRAWSAVGGAGRLVRVRYPWRPIYGVNPVVALVGGLVAVFVGLRARRFFSDVARGDSWDSLYERFEDQDWLISHVATGITFITVIPILVGAWAAFAGAADMFNTVEKTGSSSEPVAPPRSHRCRERWSNGSKAIATACTSHSTTERRTRSPPGERANVRRCPRVSTPSCAPRRSSATCVAPHRSATSSATEGYISSRRTHPTATTSLRRAGFRSRRRRCGGSPRRCRPSVVGEDRGPCRGTSPVRTPGPRPPSRCLHSA